MELNELKSKIDSASTSKELAELYLENIVRITESPASCYYPVLNETALGDDHIFHKGTSGACKALLLLNKPGDIKSLFNGQLQQVAIEPLRKSCSTGEEAGSIGHFAYLPFICSGRLEGIVQAGLPGVKKPGKYLFNLLQSFSLLFMHLVEKKDFSGRNHKKDKNFYSVGFLKRLMNAASGGGDGGQEELLSRCSREAANLSDILAVTFFVLDEGKLDLFLPPGQEQGIMDTLGPYLISIDDEIYSDCVLKGKTHFINCDADLKTSFYLSRTGIEAVAFIPLSRDGRIFGTLNVAKQDKFEQDDRKLQYFEVMACIIADGLSLLKAGEANRALSEKGEALQKNLEAARGQLLGKTRLIDNMKVLLKKNTDNIDRYLKLEALIKNVSHLTRENINYSEAKDTLKDVILHLNSAGSVSRNSGGHTAVELDVKDKDLDTLVNMLKSKRETIVPAAVAERGRLAVVTEAANGRMACGASPSFIDDEFEINYLNDLAMIAEIAINNIEIKRNNFSKYLNLLEILTSTLELKIGDPSRHSLKVMRVSAYLASKMGFPEDKMNVLKTGAILHDIGKYILPREILAKKREELEEHDWDMLKSHTKLGIELLGFREGQEERDILLYHHERYDGTGYYMLKGENIPVFARIVALSDSFVAMLSERPYRPAKKTLEGARVELLAFKGSQFDPALVDLLLASEEVFSSNLFSL